MAFTIPFTRYRLPQGGAVAFDAPFVQTEQGFPPAYGFPELTTYIDELPKGLELVAEDGTSLVVPPQGFIANVGPSGPWQAQHDRLGGVRIKGTLPHEYQHLRTRIRIAPIDIRIPINARTGDRSLDAPLEFVVAQPEVAGQTNVPMQLAALNYASGDIRIGAGVRRLRYDEPQSRYLFMGLPQYAPPNNGFVAGYAREPEDPPNPQNPAINQQWLAVENIQEFQPPEIRSTEVQNPVEVGQYITHGFAVDQPRRTTEAQSLAFAKTRVRIEYGQARLRILWNEKYASHGGTYGLRQASMNMGLSVPWVYYYHDHNSNPPIGRIISTWVGQVTRLREFVTRDAIVVDVVVQPDSGLYYPPLTTGFDTPSVVQASE